MHPFPLPASLSALSSNEKAELFELPWRTSTFETLPEGNFSFVILQGALFNIQDKTFHHPGYELLGVLPLVKQKRSRYKVKSGKCIVAYLDTNLLATFILSHPGFFRSFIFSMQNMLKKPLARFAEPGNLYLISAENGTPESFHLAMGLSLFIGRTKKVLYIEGQRDIQSIFSFLELTAPSALVDSIEPGQLEAHLEANIVEHSENVHLLNLQYLAINDLPLQYWATLYQLLRLSYQVMVVHMGTNQNQLIENSANFIFHLSPGSTIRQVKRAYTPVIHLSLQRPEDEISHDRRDIYPVSLSSSSDDFVTAYPSHHPYWGWLESHYSPILNEEALIIADSFNNPEGLSALLHALAARSSGVSLHDEELKIANFMKSHAVICHGISSVITLLASTNIKFAELKAIVSRLHKKNFLSSFKPVYPRRGIFAQKPLTKYFSEIFGKAGLTQTGIMISFFDRENEEVRWQASGEIVEALMLGAFSPGLIQKKEHQKYFKIPESHTSNELAYAFRCGFSHIRYCTFPQRKPVTGQVAESFLLNERSALLHKESSVEVIQVFNPAIEDFWIKEESIATELYQTI